MSITNAGRHVEIEKKGEWRVAKKLHPCSRYFGDVASCARAIATGQSYFDTEESAPDAGVRGPFVVCGNCANAAHSTNFLSGQPWETA